MVIKRTVDEFRFVTSETGLTIETLDYRARPVTLTYETPRELGLAPVTTNRSEVPGD